MSSQSRKADKFKLIAQIYEAAYANLPHCHTTFSGN